MKAGKVAERGTVCFVPLRKAARRAGRGMSVPVARETVSWNLAGWAVSQKRPVSPSRRPSLRAR